MKAGTVHFALQPYLDRPEVVDGWVTDQAVVLVDGTLKSTQYYQYGENGLVLRASLGPENKESEAGLLRRFASGERFLALSDITGEILNRVRGTITDPELLGFIAADFINPDQMNETVFMKLQALAESMQVSAAKGEDADDGFDARYAEVKRLLDASPFQMHPDYGCVRNEEVALRDAGAAWQATGATTPLPSVLQVLENIKTLFEEAESAWACLPADARKQIVGVESDHSERLAYCIERGALSVNSLVAELKAEAEAKNEVANDGQEPS